MKDLGNTDRLRNGAWTDNLGAVSLKSIFALSDCRALLRLMQMSSIQVLSFVDRAGLYLYLLP
jgi:hypothetical protein